MESTLEPPRLLTAGEAADWCRISVNSLNHLRTHGRFAPAIKIGRRCFWTADDLTAWIFAQREAAR
ncbi:MAG: helix-turn-helix domain-containing protein [Dermatophilus congolensis]|nr:helix-turn-helix domain-containing protein [Dermatophilus congolensis]